MLFFTGLLTGILFALMGVTAIGIHSMHEDQKDNEYLKHEQGKDYGSRNKETYFEN